MAIKNHRAWLAATAVLAINASFASAAHAQTAETAPRHPDTASRAPGQTDTSGAAQSSVGDIIVTAQKREQSINRVGLTIQAIGASELQNRGIRGAEDLVKAVPGFTFTPSPYSTPVYTLRGVGLYDSGLASTPSVSVYVDEVPLAFPIMTKGATLDLERVEVLKGPQGTLFGQSSTGGAVNYITAKPTNTPSAGGYASINQFGGADLEAFASGPLSETLRARLAVRSDTGGAWQKSTSRGDKLGDAGLLEGRLLLDWHPSDRVKFALNLNGYRDTSDPLAPSLIAVASPNPTLLAPGFATAQPARNPRDADWAEGFPHRDNSFYQGSLRADIGVAEDVTLTSISSYQHSRVDERLPQGGTPLPYQNILHNGFITSYDQELRLAGDSGSLNWLVGASYEHVRADDNLIYDQSIVSNRQPIPGLAPYLDVGNTLTQQSNTAAAFANAEYKLGGHLTLRGGLRYTRYRNTGTGCSYETLPSDELGQLFQVLQFVVKGSFVPIAPGQCASLDENFNPAAADLRLQEHNLSWRIGGDYRTDGGTLFYATVSRGYKSGILPILAASRTAQYQPAGQERLDAYETGIKAPLLGRKLQLNASAFYYDYTNKQIRGTILDPVFGKLEREINIPASRVFGLETELIAQPVHGLNLSLGATYLDSAVRHSFAAYNSDGVLIDAKGSQLPFTPKVQVVGDVEYAVDVGRDVQAFVGGDGTYHSSDNSSLRNAAVPASEFDIKPYTVFDFRAGLQSPDTRWRATLFVENAFNVLRWDTVFRLIDAYHRFQERPRTVGASLRYRFK
jgi:iron complex outermembrane receptor protein